MLDVVTLQETDLDFDQCAVCIEQYRPSDVIRILPCKYVYIIFKPIALFRMSISQRKSISICFKAPTHKRNYTSLYLVHKTIESIKTCFTCPFRHVFHKSCVDPWLIEQRSCPMCKLDILKAYGLQVSTRSHIIFIYEAYTGTGCITCKIAEFLSARQIVSQSGKSFEFLNDSSLDTRKQGECPHRL